PRIVTLRPEQAVRGDRADAPAAGRALPQRAAPGGPDDAGQDPRYDRPGAGPEFEEIRAGRPRPRPSSTFLAQAIGQELEAESPGTAGVRGAGSVAALYRETRETVDRAQFAGLTLPPDRPA
ncbi:hypothetical protein, partial [Thalassobaculum sp.]|uniref:hypothetical protein n=1 Tax=Thalassobaculum sp. TaxID=2022740 RepID=UPI0032F01865